MTEAQLSGSTPQKRLAIIGCGSGGLITLKTALAELPAWQVVCFEKSDQVLGCWGNPYPGFVSTSTKYTTQFACFPERDATVDTDGGQSRAEFYRGAEYGQYLNRFADAFQLRPQIKLGHLVERLVRAESGHGWTITHRPTAASDPTASVSEQFDAVVVCTGLAAQIKQIETTIPVLSLSELNAPEGISNIRNERIVVFGGGESAVDFAMRLSQPELGNQVYLSLRSGVRVSPRYHPIRGVPSDFLRNRLMLSIHPAMRNWIGQRFVEARILHQELFERWFPAANPTGPALPGSDIQALRKAWAYKLTKAAKDDLFNMFHNKSDDFLDGVARGRIKIVGPPVDESMQSFVDFDTKQPVDIHPTKILPAIGYKSTLSSFADGTLRVPDFYLGCCHASFPDLFLVGFARPIIGNIPTISEIQAAYVCGLISGRFSRPDRIAELTTIDQHQKAVRFAKLNLEALYPVEMFTYCDLLARKMSRYPGVRNLGSLGAWWTTQIAPATTAHYLYHDAGIRQFFERGPVYMPTLLIAFLLLLKPFDWVFRAVRWLRYGGGGDA